MMGIVVGFAFQAFRRCSRIESGGVSFPVVPGLVLLGSRELVKRNHLWTNQSSPIAPVDPQQGVL